MRWNVKGYLPGVSTDRAPLFVFSRILARWLVGRPVFFTGLRQRNKTDIYVKDDTGGKAWEFIPGRGRVMRPCLLSLSGVLAKRRVGEEFTVTPVRSVLPSKLGTQVLTTTDCPLSTGGIGKYLNTSAPVFVSVIKGSAGDARSAWEEF